MILLRKNSFSDSSIEIPFKDSETVKDLVSRVLVSNGYEDSEAMHNHFQVLVNGLRLEKEFWEITVTKESDQVLIAPIISRGEGGQLFKTFAIIAITVAASAFFSPAAGASFGAYIGSALAVAAVSIGSTLLLNSLIPPPGLPGMGGLGSLDGLESSQMYSISSQSNAAKKFGSVPKVYGTHKIFPIIASNPYTEIEADPETKELVQYFYAIYDFGFGPCKVRDLKIGETPIEEFSNYAYQFVDFNKPEVDEGDWDEELFESLQYYKGDFEKESATYSLDKNSTDTSAAEDDFRVVRNAATVTENIKQEIILDFVCPQGLIGYATNASQSERTIELFVEFRRSDQPDTWRPFNDLNYVSSYQTTGGEGNIYRDVQLLMPPITGPGYDLIDTREDIVYKRQYLESIYGQTTYHTIKYYGFKKGRNYFDIETGKLSVGDNIYLYNGASLGKVNSISPSPIAGFDRCYTSSAITKTCFLFNKIDIRYDDFSSAIIKTEYTGITNPLKFTYYKPFSAGEVWVVGKTPNQKYFTVKFSPKEFGSYAIRVTRIRSYSSSSFSVQDKLTLLAVSTRLDRNPIVTNKRHTFLDFKIRATNQINGAVSNISGIVTSILDVYDPLTQTWSKQATDNPAWVFCDLLTGDINPRKIDKSRLHLDSIVEWANFCDEIPTSSPSRQFVAKRFSCNLIVDFETTLQSLINSVCNSAQASLNIIDGKYGVLIDKLRTVPVQIFTPRNSWDFASSRNYSTPPHALKIRYVSPAKDWQVEEAIVYDDGYNAETATEFQELSSFACTEYEQAWRFGRYMMAQARLRKEAITISVDFEHIVCTRGDYVQITQDVMKVGGRPARVKSVTGNIIKIDDGIDTMAVPYGYVFRSVAGIETNTLTVIDSDEFELNGPLPSVGDLIVIGPVGSIVFDCLVKSISPNDNMSATLTLVEKADAIYNADWLETLPEYDPRLNPNQDSDLYAPPPVENLEIVSNSWRVKGGDYEYYIGMDWDIGAGVAYETFEVYADTGSGYDLIDFTNQTSFEYIVHIPDLGNTHYFKVLGVSATGKKITLLEAPEVFATPVKKTTRPSDVSGLFLNVTNQVIQLEWPRIPDPDLKEYLLRYSPSTVGAYWESSIPFARISGITNTASVQGRTGTYFVKALDLNGNESLNSAQAVTSIPELFDLNVIDETNDFPLLPGERVATEFDGEALILKTLVSGSVTTNQYYSEGYYYYSNFLDLGEIYTVRLQSLIEAEGFTADDLMSNWNPLSEVLALANAGNASWDVETYYRGTDTLNVISEWTNLSLINPLSEGVQDNWTPWKKFQIGDFTARIFQFRLKLISNVVNVTPRVFDGVIRADMPDRVESYNNLISDYTPVSITYSPAFKGPGDSPNIQITQDNIQSGDYYVISNKSLNGFDIIFYDVSNNPVIRTFDIAVKGYGRKALAVI